MTPPVMPMCAMGRMKGMARMKSVSAATMGHNSGTENSNTSIQLEDKILGNWKTVFKKNYIQ